MRIGTRLLVGVGVVTIALGQIPAVGQEPDRSHLDPDFLVELDDAALHGTVTPPGAGLLEKELERFAYDELAYGYPDLTEEQLTEVYFKDGSFDVPTDIARDYRPRADVRIVRDARWGVPHVYGDTDEAMAFGAGYASAEDRLPIMELLRALGRAEAFELLEHNPAWLADAEIVRAYGYTDDEFQQMVDRLPAVYGQDGQDVVDIANAHAAGINHFITQFQEGVVDPPVGLSDLLPPNTVAPWSAKDIVAVISIVRALFGAGGGGELGNASVFASLVESYGVDDARLVYEDFRNRFQLDGPLHTTDSFPYNQPAVDLPGTDGNVTMFSMGAPGVQGALEELVDLFPGGAAQAADQLGALAEESRIKWERVDLATPHAVVDLSKAASPQMSNYIGIAGEHTTTGNPIMLGGPQAGYFDPQILVEAELHSPTVHARGAGFPGLSTLVVIGRSHEAVFTATAGGSDMIDTYVEVLCDPDGGTPTEEEVHYLHDTDDDGTAECVEMDVRLHREATSLPGGELLPAIYAERTVHGPVTARGLVGDVPVAVSRKRSTYLKEADPAVSILRMNRGQADTAEEFVDAYRDHNLSTNWAYANATETGYVHGGLYPRRPDTIHPDMPVWGTGQWEWAPAGPAGETRGDDDYLEIDEHPHEANPPRGYVASWNNRTAADWGASDNNWGYASVYRADLLEDPVQEAIAAGEKLDPVEVVQLMERAGLSDLRAVRLLPSMLRVLEAGTAPSDREATMRDLLAEWIDPAANPEGIGLRRDGDRDGDYDRGAAVAIMDAWWEPLIRAMFEPALGRGVDGVSRQGFHNAPGAGGSAFQGGFYGQVFTDLSLVLGDPIRSPTSQVYCGSDGLGTDGTLDACADALWTSLAAAGDAIAADQGDDPTAWQADAAGERITFIPPTSDTMHWVNRPTTQVLAMFGANTPDAVTPDPAPTATTEPPPAAPSPAAEDTTGRPAPVPLPATGGGLALLGVAIAVAASRRRAT